MMIGAVVRAVVVGLPAALLSAVSPAEADVPVSAYDIVLQTEHETSLWLPGRAELVLVAESDDLVVVDLSTGEQSTIPGTSGLVSLSAGIEDHLVYGAAPAASELVEVDLDSGQVRRRTLGADACPRDVVARGDFLYFLGNAMPWRSSSCGYPGQLLRLDAVSGVVAPVPGPSVHGYRARSLHAVSAAPRFISYDAGTDATATTFDLTATGEVAQVEECGLSDSNVGVLSDDAGEFLTDEWTADESHAHVYGLGDCRYVESLPVTGGDPTIEIVQGNAQHAVVVTEGGVRLVDRVTRTSRQFLLDGTAARAVDARLIGTDLYVVAFVGTEKRLYRFPAALATHLNLTLEAPREIGVDMPIEVRGVATDGGVPVSGATIVLREIAPSQRVILEATTGPDGSWSAEFFEPEPRDLVMEARLVSDGEHVVKRAAIRVHTEHYEVEVLPHDLVPAASEFTVRGVVTLNGGPVRNRSVEVKRMCWDGEHGEVEWTPSTDHSGTFEVTSVAGSCDLYEFVVEFTPGGDAPYDRYTDWVFVNVNREDTTIATPGPFDAIAGEPVQLTATLTSAVDGRPLVDEIVRMAVSVDGHGTGTFSTTTDHLGVARVTQTFMTVGNRQLRWSFGGTPAHSYTASSTWVRVAKRDTDVTITGPATARVDDQYTLSGTFSDGPVPAQLTLKERFEGGTLTVTTDDTGAWSHTVTSPTAGAKSWRILYAGDVSHQLAIANHTVSVARHPTSLVLQAPQQATVGDELEFVGSLSGIAASVDLTVTSPDGTMRPVRTDDHGSFAFIDTHTAGGEAIWTVAYPGSTSHDPAAASVTVAVSKLVPTVRLHTDRGTYTAGQVARLTVGVANSRTRRVTLTAVRSGREPRILFQGPVPDDGLTIDRTMRHTETLRVTHDEDAAHSKTTAAVIRGVKLRLATTALRPATRRDAYAIYPRTEDPTFLTRTRPFRPGTCLRMSLQRYSEGRWRTIRTSRCRTIGAEGTIRWTLTGAQHPHTQFRTRAQFRGDDLNLRTSGNWTYFRFR